MQKRRGWQRLSRRAGGQRPAQLRAADGHPPARRIHQHVRRTQVRGKARAVRFTTEYHVDGVAVAGQPLAHKFAVGVIVGGIGWQAIHRPRR